MIEQLFQIEISHRSLNLADVLIIPDGETRSIITRYCLFPTWENGRFGLHARYQSRATSFLGNLSRFGEDARLRFFLICDPDDFFPLMDLPEGRAGQLAFSSRTGIAGDRCVRLAPGMAARRVLKEKAVAVISIFMSDLPRPGGTDVTYQLDLERGGKPSKPAMDIGEACAFAGPG